VQTSGGTVTITADAATSKKYFKVRRMRKNKIIWFGICIACLLPSCKNDDRSKDTVIEKPCISCNIFFICSFDATAVDSVLIAKHHSARISGAMNLYEPAIFSKSNDINSTPVRGSIHVEDSISTNESFSVCLKIGNLSRIYNIENIIIDTIPVYHGHYCGLKSYTLDGVIHNEGNFYLGDFQK
jgi:hypothetical protein